jgi:hypothetical protein
LDEPTSPSEQDLGAFLTSLKKADVVTGKFGDSTNIRQTNKQPQQNEPPPSLFGL